SETFHMSLKGVWEGQDRQVSPALLAKTVQVRQRDPPESCQLLQYSCQKRTMSGWPSEQNVQLLEAAFRRRKGSHREPILQNGLPPARRLPAPSRVQVSPHG